MRLKLNKKFEDRTVMKCFNRQMNSEEFKVLLKELHRSAAPDWSNSLLQQPITALVQKLIELFDLLLCC